MTNKETIEVKMTPADVAKLIKQKTNQDINTEEPFEIVIENTKELPPYSLVTFRTDKVKVHMTPTHVMELIKQTDENINAKDYWFETVIECTMTSPHPLLTFKAHKR